MSAKMAANEIANFCLHALKLI